MGSAFARPPFAGTVKSWPSERMPSASRCERKRIEAPSGVQPMTWLS